jgi:hypothetical protein
MTQFGLPLDWPANENEQDFIRSQANFVATRHLERLSLWPLMATILTGPRKSGRSFMGRLFAAKTGGMLIDNAEQADEEDIFHAWNRAQSDRRPLLIIADAPPPIWDPTLPDLRSRLAATPHVSIQEPDDAMVPAMIERLVGVRGLSILPDVVAYLSARVERSYVGIHRLVDMLDSLSLTRRSRLSIPLARDALAAIGVIDDS